MDGSSEFLTTTRASERLGASMRYIRDLVKQGTLRTVRVEGRGGKLWTRLIRRADVEALIVKRVTKHLRAS